MKKAPQDEEMIEKLRSLGYISGAPQSGFEAESRDRAAGLRSRREMSKRARLEDDLKEISEKAKGGNVPIAPRAARGVAGTVQPSNQVLGISTGAVQAGAGIARGVLPVRFSIPTEGLRLSFSGRLLTADERARVSLSGWPLAWT